MASAISMPRGLRITACDRGGFVVWLQHDYRDLNEPIFAGTLAQVLDFASAHFIEQPAQPQDTHPQ